MSLFNRRKNAKALNLPPEVQAYSQAEHRERVGMAWLVGIVSLLITLVVLTGVFFGGRWLYREIANGNNKDNANASTSQPADKSATNSDNTTQKKSADNSSDQSSAAKSNSSSSNSASTTTPAPATTTQPPVAANTNSTSTAANGLAHTGPADTLNIFLAVTALSAILHRVYVLRRTDNA